MSSAPKTTEMETNAMSTRDMTSLIVSWASRAQTRALEATLRDQERARRAVERLDKTGPERLGKAAGEATGRVINRVAAAGYRRRRG